MNTRASQNYICKISYGAPTPPVSIAKYEFISSSCGQSLYPGDTITFVFDSPTQVAPHKATLLTSCKTPAAKHGGSPFFNDANGIDILSFPTLTIGQRHGTWGLAALFTIQTQETSHFYFLPDPEIIVSPE